jgi:hypothetical protein
MNPHVPAHGVSSPSEAVRSPRSLGRAVAVGFGRGLLSGLVATVAHSAVMFAAQKAGLLGRMPPRRITDRFLDLAGVRRQTPEPARRALAVVSHIVFGAASGALFGIGNEVYRERIRPSSPRALVASGLLYGTAIWAVSYAGWVPAVGAMPHAATDRRHGRQPAMVLAHWAYGVVLAKLLA